MIRKIATGLVLLATAALIYGLVALQAESKDNKKPKEGSKVGETAFDFTLEDIDGAEHTLSDYRGKKAVLLVFWYLGCPHCVKEIPTLKKLHKEYASKGLKILALNVYDSREKLKKYAKKNGIEYTILDDSSQEILREYGVMGVPTNILVDLKGVIRYRNALAPSEKLIKSLLPKPKKKDGKEDGKKK